MLRNTKYFLLFLILVFSIEIVKCQVIDHVPESKAKKSFERALDYWNGRDYDKAEKELLKAIKIDTLYVDPYLLLADINYDRKNMVEAISLYDKAISLSPDISPTVFLLCGKACLESGDYQKAVERLTEYLAFQSIRNNQREIAAKQLRIAQFRAYAIQNPVPFKAENLGSGVNSVNDEFVNSITLDESNIVFTLMVPDTLVKGHFREGFEMAVRDNSEWKPAGRALPDLYELGNIGAMSLSPDGQFLFFTSCGSAKGYGSCDLFVCGRKGSDWSDPQNLGDVVNTPYWDSQPCFSADGQTLFFSSARPGGKGGSDIYFTKFKQSVGWSEPQNAGDNINTDHEEMAPFIHADGQSMYFSSKGHTGMGGFDLFISRQDSSGLWQTPVNMGYPINTSSDEINMVVSTNGKAAYLSSDLEGGFGGYDIYSFDLPQELGPRQVTYLEGNVYDAESKLPLGAELQLLDLESGDLKVRCGSREEDGYYIAALPGGKNYALHISKPGYLFYSENVDLSLEDVLEKPVRKDVYLQPVRTGQSFVLNNIFFDTDEFSLSDLSLVELYKLNAFLVINPEISIKICGHTDDVGTAEYNQVLSQKRAASVYSFLVEVGIDSQRLKYEGFGKSQPVSDNTTEKGRAENRRTEIVIL